MHLVVDHAWQQIGTLGIYGFAILRRWHINAFNTLALYHHITFGNGAFVDDARIDYLIVHNLILTSASISTGTLKGSSAMPTAERLCAPTSGPKTSKIRSEQPLMTPGN